ncbi:MAG: hypothetical protein M3209_14100 [Acidobacteriota bacterium]|nr:hypothetical protein [Acidobacteriota bacterium]
MSTEPSKSGKLSFVLILFLLLGAVASAATFTVNQTDDAGDLTCDATCTLRDAIDDANAASGADTIVFDGGVFGTPQMITLTGGNLIITNSTNANVNITGPGSNLLAISGGNASKIFTITETPVVVISGITLTQGNAIGASPGNNYGGAIYNQGNLTLNDVVITGNSATLDGGGIYVSTGDSLTINNSTISGNNATGDGGGIYGNASSTVSVSNTTVSNNTAGKNGGGAYSDDGSTLTVSGSIFSGNTAQTPTSDAGGGGIYIDSANFNLTDSTIRNNISNLNGGGLAFDSGGTSTITGSTINGNTATGKGGGMYLEDTPLNIINSTTSGNSANLGGGLYRDSQNPATIFLNFSTVVNNNTTNGGGGIFVLSSPIDVGNTIIGDNTAPTAPDVSGSLNSLGYNLIENTSGANIGGNSTGNITGQDPMLETLGDNGGPTQTHRLILFSPAIDNANTTNFPATDQRGIARPIDGNSAGGAQPDIGSYEASMVTAAKITVAGRVSNGKRGVAGAFVQLTDQNGNTRGTRTNSFGYYRFDDVDAGQTYIFNAYSKQFQFAPQVVTINETAENLNFEAMKN